MLHQARYILWRHYEGAPDCLHTNERTWSFYIPWFWLTNDMYHECSLIELCTKNMDVKKEQQAVISFCVRLKNQQRHKPTGGISKKSRPKMWPLIPNKELFISYFFGISLFDGGTRYTRLLNLYLSALNWHRDLVPRSIASSWTIEHTCFEKILIQCAVLEYGASSHFSLGNLCMKNFGKILSQLGRNLMKF